MEANLARGSHVLLGAPLWTSQTMSAIDLYPQVFCGGLTLASQQLSKCTTPRPWECWVNHRR
eukprot:5345670-Amphidinium_carterae.1